MDYSLCLKVFKLSKVSPVKQVNSAVKNDNIWHSLKKEFTTVFIQGFVKYVSHYILKN